MKLNQLFCRHVYKITKKERLGTVSQRTYTSYANGRIFTFNYYDVAVYKTCLKCGKVIIEDGVER